VAATRTHAIKSVSSRPPMTEIRRIANILRS
jgi:hypothetical protein